MGFLEDYLEVLPEVRLEVFLLVLLGLVVVLALVELKLVVVVLLVLQERFEITTDIHCRSLFLRQTILRRRIIVMKRRTLLDRILLMFALAGCLSLASCKKKMPSEVIKPAEMENILYDYHLAQALGSEYNGEERYKRELLLQYVFEKHHVTKAEFDSSMVWYTRNMEELGNIYKNLERRYD